MELVEGPTLAGRLKRGAIPLDEVLPLARQIAEALEYAHELGIIHRDLKPANINVTPEGNVKVLDFGLAKALERAPAAGDPADSPTLSAAATRAGELLGTAAYMSPEQARGRPADRRADIWAFGVMLWEMLTGRRMFAGETVSDSLAAVMRGEIDLSVLPPNTPANIRRLLRRRLERDTKQRLQAIGEARISIDEAATGERSDAVQPQSRRRKTLTVAAAVLLMAFGVLAGMFFRPPPPVIESPVRRFTIVPGPLPGERAVISPDGRHITYVGEGSKLWIRDMDREQPRALDGTEGATDPFWSPDSESIGFAMAGQVKRFPSPGALLPLFVEFRRSGFLVAVRGVRMTTRSCLVAVLSPLKRPQEVGCRRMWDKSER